MHVAAEPPRAPCEVPVAWRGRRHRESRRAVPVPSPARRAWRADGLPRQGAARDHMADGLERVGSPLPQRDARVAADTVPAVKEVCHVQRTLYRAARRLRGKLAWGGDVKAWRSGRLNRA